MRTPGSPRGVRHAAASLATAAMLALAGCAGSGDAAPTGTAAQDTSAVTPTPAPTELTEAEALDIAVATYEEFLAVEGAVFDDGGESIDDMKNLVTDNMSEYVSGLEESAGQDDYTVTGSIKVRDAEMQAFDSDSISIYACLDFSESSLTDSAGQPVGGDRESAFEAKEVRLVRDGETFLIDKAAHWDNDSFCA
jgi:hypothetical protein